MNPIKLILSIFCFSTFLLVACNKDSKKMDSQPENKSEISGRLPKSISTDYTLGVKTITYRDGRTQIIKFSPDTTNTRLQRSSTGSRERIKVSIHDNISQLTDSLLIDSLSRGTARQAVSKCPIV